MQIIQNAKNGGIFTDFKDITIQDKEWMQQLFAKSNARACEYCFSNSFNWRAVYNVKVARMNDFLVVQCTKPIYIYSYPAGSGDIKLVIEAMIQDAKDRNVPFLMNCILNENKALLEEIMPGVFDFTAERDVYDYIYTSESLATLAGKKLHGKRNHINNFIATYPNWKYEAITKDNIDECMIMNSKWCDLYGCQDDESLRLEGCAVKSAFDNFQQLDLVGGLLRAEDDIVAFTIGRPLNSDTFIVHIEKAYHDIQGAYPMINQQFILNNAMNFTYVNREDDTGAEGLRKAKLSYRPEILLEKYSAVLRNTI